jgi:LysR family glycine cleavage system transcriptional activator/LysR family transcriptional regulator of beta-lactamase
MGMWLPSLKGLRAVEAALRLGSFAAAAKELSVTQTAISRLVKDVERQFGRPLFQRQANQSVPTPMALAMQQGLTDGFRRLESTVAEARRGIDDPTVTLAVGPTFAMRWLIPRLTEFHAEFPQVDLRLATTIGREVTPGPDTIASIRLAEPQSVGFVSDALFPGRLILVCRPDLARKLAAPADLARQTLLDVRHAPDDWPRWLAAAGLPDRGRFHTLSFDFSAFAIQAALDGVGVALVREPYVADDLRVGRLATPFDLSLEDKALCWRLIYRPEARSHASFRTFRRWLLARAKAQG